MEQRLCALDCVRASVWCVMCGVGVGGDGGIAAEAVGEEGKEGKLDDGRGGRSWLSCVR